MTEWGDLDARARGLATRLPSPAALDRLAEARGPDEPARSIRALLGVPGADGAGDPERAIRAAVAARTSLLRRWAGPRRERALRVVFEDEDRRSARALLRGAAQGAPAERRLAGLVPTPALPPAALEALARERAVEIVVAGLLERGHPFGPPLAARIAAGPFDLLALEVETARAFARRALEAAGDAVLDAHVREGVDLENAWSALLSGSLGGDLEPGAVFVDGGRAIDRATYAAAARIEAVDGGREVLARAFRRAGSALADPFADPTLDASRLPAAVLAARIRALHGRARTDPLSPAPLLEYALRLRALAIDLRRASWGRAMGAPASVVAAERAGAP